MAGSTNFNRLLNPSTLHFQKLGLELKCPLCLNLLNRPMLLPCNHIFCNYCIPRSTQFGAGCPVCKAQYAVGDLRPAPYIENMVTIYRSLDATFCANIIQPFFSDSGRPSDQRADEANVDFVDKAEALNEGNLSSGQSVFSFTANKRVQLRHNHFIEDINDPNNVNEPENGHGKEFESCDIGEKNPTPPPPNSAGSSPHSGLDNDSSNKGSERHNDNYRAKRHVGASSDDEFGKERDDKMDFKRCKMANYGSSDIGLKGLCHSSETVLCTESTETPIVADTSNDNKTICAFCQTSILTEATGLMMYYSDGNPVLGDEAMHPNVIHVHTRCIEWAPQVYYVGETVKNLKEEIARGAKLKCSSCGLKGAALGCYAKSCRKTFHVPCAVNVEGCRWDCENFLMLCSAHSSFRFPNEKSKSGKHASKTNPVMPENCRTSQQINFWGTSLNGGVDWVLCGSALSSEEKTLLLKFGSMSGATIVKYWSPKVTHVIASIDEKGACTRTLKVLMAILNGKWIVKIDWMKACMESMHPVDEEPYEVSLDNHGCSDGPRTGRLRALDNAPRLFNGLSFYFSGDFTSGYKEDLQDLVVAAGGEVINKEEWLFKGRKDIQTTSKPLVVYNLDPPQGCQIGDEVSILLHRLEEAEELAAEIGSHVIAHTWLLESMAACKLQPFTT